MVFWVQGGFLGDGPSQSTLLRHFRTLDLPVGRPAQATGRFEASHPNEIWVGDGLHGPRIGGRKTYLFALLDDHARLVPAGRWSFAEDTVRLSAALRPALSFAGDSCDSARVVVSHGALCVKDHSFTVRADGGRSNVLETNTGRPAVCWELTPYSRVPPAERMRE